MPYAHSEDLTLYYETVGIGEPVLWLQGLGAQHTAWAVQTAHFSRSFRCILPDNRDAGRSSRSDSPYSIATLAADALSVLDAAREDSAHIVGLSMGASIAQELALSAPHRVRSLTLLASFARPDARLRTLTELWPELYERLGRAMFYRQAELWLFSPAFFEVPSNLRALRRYVANDPYPQSPASFARQIEASNAHDTLGRLGDLRQRTLVVSGEQDILVPPYLGRQLADGIRDAAFVLRPGVAHSVNLEGQRAFNELLQSFLKAEP